MSEKKATAYYVYVELDPDIGEFLDKMKAMGIDKRKVVEYAMRRLWELDIRDFLAEMWIPEAKRLDVYALFKGKKEGVAP